MRKADWMSCLGHKSTFPEGEEEMDGTINGNLL